MLDKLAKIDAQKWARAFNTLGITSMIACYLVWYVTYKQNIVLEQIKDGIERQALNAERNGQTLSQIRDILRIQSAQFHPEDFRRDPFRVAKNPL